mmetsp:Transcript_7077/g.19807  ORF Transcript_7077/g.19807 Transcript_7077/m.19807 type:complete len:577 (-) Transcript_7077:138-1868(-)|eukprot:CAMPEP_0168748510 /NCGR_PEP_ID=MMETSP0724-20121128/16214_1 /TAXON_ID=265536 /ORGANISM="Amphiprora sp., Strain CCMP467" /LENGTH=576 /DNA_ID=CAMNT_0008796343 /DNA_START=142 /DNA_END=1872 /DNA_ORIENTATION=-
MASQQQHIITEGQGRGRKSSDLATTAAVLVTGPSCADPRIGEDAQVVKVEPERCETVSTDNLGAGIFNMFSGFMGGGDDKQPVELQDMMDQDRAIKIMPAPSNRRKDGDFDDCQEYSLTTEDRVYDGYSPTGTPSLIPADDNVDGSTATSALSMRAYVLGKSYHPVNDYDLRRDDEANLFWFTYRCEFPEIAPYKITSDAGWGCMLRSAQMMLGQALRLHFTSRDWKPPRLYHNRRQNRFLRSALSWFADFPSTTQNFYSLHNMVAAGLKYDKLPGEWYGPQTACFVLRDLVDMHERYQLANIAPKLVEVSPRTNTESPRRIFRVHVAPQGTVYRDLIQDLMTRESKARMDKEKEKKHQANPQAHPLDLEWEEELVESVGGPAEWDTGLLLLIPARLGLDSFNADYVTTVAHYFSFPQSVGCLGGRVRGARWFYGAVSDGSKVFGLDPHTVQAAPKSRQALINGRMATAIELSDDYLRSCHTTYHEVLMLPKMDPSIALGFYCKDQADLEQLFASVETYQKENSGQPSIFAVEDAAPSYASPADSGMVSSGLMDDDAPFDEGPGGDSENEDDFVML